MHPRHFRLRILFDIARVLALPQLFALACTTFFNCNPSVSIRLLLHIAAVPLSAVCHNWYSAYVNRRDAASLGAVIIPYVRGKWPGNLDIAIRIVRSMHEDYLMQYMADLFDEYGCTTINTRILWSDQIVTISESNVKYMLTGPGFEWFHKGYYWQERFEKFLGNGIFNRDHDEWHNHRLLSRPWFAKDRISDLGLFDRHAAHTLSHISTFAQEEQAFDAQDLFSRFTLDTALEFLCGSSVNSLEGALPKAGETKEGREYGTFAWAFEDVKVKVSTRMRIGTLWPLFELFRDKTSKSNAIVHDWLRPLVERAVMEKEKGEKKGDEEKTFLSHLAENTDDVEMIRFQILNMLLAGRDTTATTLTFVVYFLCLHPDVSDRLREEILRTHGEDSQPTIDTMRNLKYLRAVLNETIRLFPPVPMNMRLSDTKSRAFPANEKDQSPQYYLPPNTQILYIILLIQRRKDLWGDDADEFKPERWLDEERLKALSRNPFMFIPFHAGPRICLGQNFAYNEMSFFLVRLMQKFRQFELANDAQPEGSLPPTVWTEEGKKGRQRVEKVWPMSCVTTFVKGGLWVRALCA